MRRGALSKITFLVLIAAMVVTMVYPFEKASAAIQPVSIVVNNLWLPQNKDTSNVSTPKWNTSANAVYDSLSGFKPYSNWPSIDYTNSTGKATGQDRVLRQAEVKVTVINTSTGQPASGYPVTLSTTLGSSAYIKNPSSSTDSTGVATGYIEFYGTPTFTITATASGNSSTSTYSTGTASYYNRFYVTKYKFALYSNSNNWNTFVSDVCMQGSGYDDRTTEKKWYKAVVSGGSCTSIAATSQPLTQSGTTPTENRTIAVDSPYITRRQYYDNAWYRGRVEIAGMSNSSGDSGRRTAEDSGGAINGYHIDVFIGYKTIAQFATAHPDLPIDSGQHFARLKYISTLREVLQ
ncbi:hypothetical protein [Gorillibacterium sp. CAU 1737]|uniref:hypothetical protein n=1 Tax=Gorillibacterium sp. CAU 1737 TaxID=3140362 RepID=UPI003260C068